MNCDWCDKPGTTEALPLQVWCNSVEFTVRLHARCKTKWLTDAKQYGTTDEKTVAPVKTARKIKRKLPAA